jgi:hypothetical protein
MAGAETPSSSGSPTPPPPSKPASSSGNTSKRILYFLSGPSVDDPQDLPNQQSTTTEHAAILLAWFVRRAFHDDLSVHHISSGTEMLRYDVNVAFLKAALVPHVDSLRRGLVAAHAERWKKRLTVTISMAAGSPARLAALNAALRQYQPSYLHLPNVKGFWYTGDANALLASCHYLDWDDIEGTPAVPIDALDEDAQLVVQEMKKHMANVLRVVRGTPDFRIYHPAPTAGLAGLGGGGAGGISSAAASTAFASAFASATAGPGLSLPGAVSLDGRGLVQAQDGARSPSTSSVAGAGAGGSGPILPITEHHVRMSAGGFSSASSASSVASAPGAAHGKPGSLLTSSQQQQQQQQQQQGGRSRSNSRSSTNSRSGSVYGGGYSASESESGRATPAAMLDGAPAASASSTTFAGGAAAGGTPVSMSKSSGVSRLAAAAGVSGAPLTPSAAVAAVIRSSAKRRRTDDNEAAEDPYSADSYPRSTSVVSLQPHHHAHSHAGHAGCGGGGGVAASQRASCGASPPLFPAEEPNHELAQFWLRKTRSPVLAVLYIRKGPFAPRQYFYGMNLEVSMPTGSVCSERVAISMALAADPGLKRKDIKSVAVLSMPKLNHPDMRVQAAYEAAGVAPASNFYRFFAPPSGNAGSAPISRPVQTTMVSYHGPNNTHSGGLLSSRSHASTGSGLTSRSPLTLSQRDVVDTGLVSLPASTYHTSGAAIGHSHPHAQPLSTQAPRPVRSESNGSVASLGAGADTMPPPPPIARSTKPSTSRPLSSASSANSDSEDLLPTQAATSSVGAMSQRTTKRAQLEVGGPEGAEDDKDKLFASELGGATGLHRSAIYPVPGRPASRTDATAHTMSPPPSANKLHRSAISMATNGTGAGMGASGVFGPQSPETYRHSSVVRNASDGSGVTVEILKASNPLAPCGSCMEWLRKIAEVSPEFRILTFTDISCERVFVKPVPF